MSLSRHSNGVTIILNDPDNVEAETTIVFEGNTYTVHDNDTLRTITLNSPISIRDYYGNKVAMYFAFLQYYTYSLLFLSIKEVEQ